MLTSRPDAEGALRPKGQSDLSSFSSWSLICLLLLPCFASAAHTSIVLLIVWIFLFFLSNLKLPKAYLILVCPFIALIALGASHMSMNPPMAALKDLWYVSKVIVAIGAGFYFARHLTGVRQTLSVIVVAGLVAGLIHIIEFIDLWTAGFSVFEIRNDGGVRGFFITIIALSLLVSIPRRLTSLSRFLWFFALLVCSFSLFLSASRTYIIIFLAMAVVLKGWDKVSFRSLMKLAVLATVLVSVIFFVSASLVENNSSEKTLAKKFRYSLQELTMEDYSTKRDINLNWRGFESYRAWQDFLNATRTQQVFGKGLGSSVDLGFYMQLGESELRFIPVLHNGFMYVLLKFGVLGLLVYLFFLGLLIKVIPDFYRSRSKSSQIIMVLRCITAIGWSFVATSFVIAGVFNKSTMMPALILLGLLSGLVSKSRLYRAPPLKTALA